VHDKERGIVPAGSWDPVEAAALETVGGPVVDARSGEFVRRIRTPRSAWTLRVVTAGDDGRRLAVSHWNKLHKGLLVAALVRERPRIGSVRALVEWARSNALGLEVVGDRALDLVV